MAEFKEAPAGASMGVKLTTWTQNRFPTAFEEYKKQQETGGKQQPTAAQKK